MDRLVRLAIDLFKSISKGRTPAELAVSALLITALILFLVMLVVAEPANNTAEAVRGIIYKGYGIPRRFELLFLFGLPSGSIVLWFLLYVITQREYKDIYSDTREKIVGRWRVTYQASVGYASVPSRSVECIIRENTFRKLTFKFDISDNPIFEDHQDQIVRDIALRENEKGGFSLFYYFDMSRKITQNIRDLLVEGEAKREIQVETLGMLEFEESTDKKKRVDRMHGKWYDLNGNMMRIFTLMSMRHEQGDKFAPIDFDAIPISQIHFDADMGEVVWSRMQNPEEGDCP